MPRAVTSAMANILPAISALGPALLGVFAVMELPKLIAGLKEASYWVGGFGKEAQAAFESAVKASDEAYTHFKDIKTGISLRNEVNQNIAALTVQRDVLDQTGGSALNYARAIAQFAQGNIAAGAAYISMARAQQLTTEQLAKLENTRLEQLNRETELEKEASRSRRETTDRLAELLAKERDQAEQLEIGGNKQRQLLKAYNDEIRAIDNAIAAAGKKGLSDKQEQEATDAKALALRNYHTALEQLAPVFPPIVAEMRKIEESLFAEKIHQQALALMGLDDAAKKVKLSIPDYAAQIKLLGPALNLTATATQQLTAAQRAALPTVKEIQIIHQNLAKLFPQYTKEQIDAKAAELARNQGLIQLLTKTEQLGQGTRSYREELKQLVQTIQQLSGAERENLTISAQWVQALKDEKQAIDQNKVAAVQGVAEGVAALIGGRIRCRQSHRVLGAIYRLVGNGCRRSSGGCPIHAGRSPNVQNRGQRLGIERWRRRRRRGDGARLECRRPGRRGESAHGANGCGRAARPGAADSGRHALRRSVNQR
jgi:hypothetical protein